MAGGHPLVDQLYCLHGNPARSSFFNYTELSSPVELHLTGKQLPHFNTSDYSSRINSLDIHEAHDFI